MNAYKIYALHFEPKKEILLNQFVDSEGCLLIEPDYEIEIDKKYHDFITKIVNEFPKKLDFGWMCAPYYRDVFIWKNTSGQVLKTFQMCFSCDQYLSSNGKIQYIAGELLVENVFIGSIDKLKSHFREFDKIANYQRNGDEISFFSGEDNQIEKPKKEKIVLPIKRPWLK